MKLCTYCKSCKADISIKSSAQTRPELQMEKGNSFTVRCEECRYVEDKHINDIKAEINQKIFKVFMILSIFIALGITLFFGFLGTLVLIIPFIFWQQQRNEVKAFNSYTIKR